MKSNQPIFLGPAEGAALSVLGTTYTVKVTSAQTAGAFSLIEAVSPPQSGVPPHLHHREQETFYILEGSMEVQCAGKTFTAAKGATVVLPQGVPHSYRNPGNIPAKYLVLVQPAGFEGFFAEAAKLSADRPPDLAQLAAIGQKFGLELLPP
jgi:mannose-6-phosphate isomerase-like protein (cupin superfamily)